MKELSRIIEEMRLCLMKNDDFHLTRREMKLVYYYYLSELYSRLYYEENKDKSVGIHTKKL